MEDLILLPYVSTLNIHLNALFYRGEWSSSASCLLMLNQGNIMLYMTVSMLSETYFAVTVTHSPDVLFKCQKSILVLSGLHGNLNVDPEDV